MAADRREAAAQVQGAAVAGYSERVNGAALPRHTWVELGVDAAVGEDVADLGAGLATKPGEGTADIEAAAAVRSTRPHLAVVGLCQWRDPLSGR